MELNKIAENISAINTPSIGIAGEVRCVVTKPDGTIKTDTGFQKNLILDQGLEFFGGARGSVIYQNCLIGGGNTAPNKTQGSLDVVLGSVTGAAPSYGRNYVDDGSGLYKTSITHKYQFTGLNNVNISEVGLASQYTSKTSYYLCTRALIKDGAGTPTSITIKSGEILDVYYKIWQVIATGDQSNVVNMVDGAGVTTPYNVKHRPMSVGPGNDVNALVGSALGRNGFGSGLDNNPAALSQDLVAITAKPAGSLGYSTLDFKPYVANSYKRVLEMTFSLNDGNGSIRTFSVPTTMGHWQVRYGSAENDSPIVKTNKATLTVPLEFSWGRYEGDL